MKKGLSIALIVVGILLLGTMIANLANGGIWILEGLNGRDGTDGRDGLHGSDGINGKSAYELAVEDGFSGTLHEWLLSLSVRGMNGAPGEDGNDGTGVTDVSVNTEGHLIVTLSDGRILDAGAVAGTFSEVPVTDEAGFTEVYEMVVQNGTYATLTLRKSPDTSEGEIWKYVSAGDELLRIGINKETGFSRFLCEGEICYARSKFFDLKYLPGTGLPELHLPDRMVLTHGVKTCFVTGEILPDPAGFHVSFEYSGAGERVYDGEEFFSLTPEWSEDVLISPHAPETATLTVLLEKEVNGDVQSYRKTVRVTVVDAAPTLTATGILIGDSRISDGTIVNTLHNDLPGLELLGTRTSPGGGVPHEGRGAWSTANYLNEASVSVAGTDLTNPFFNPGTGKFDFGYYMEQNYPSATLDFVLFNLGANDSFSEESVANLSEMVDSVLRYADGKGRQIRILILTEYLSPAKDFYLAQNGNVSVTALRAKQFRYFSCQQTAFAGREAEGIYLIPNYLCVNFFGDRQCAEITTEEGTGIRVTDLSHLGLTGYRKEARMIESYLFCLFGQAGT